MVKRITKLTEARPSQKLDFSQITDDQQLKTIKDQLKAFYPNYGEHGSLATNSKQSKGLNKKSIVNYIDTQGNSKTANISDFIKEAATATHQFIKNYKGHNGSYEISYTETGEILQEVLNTHMAPDAAPNLQTDTLFFKLVLLTLIGSQISAKHTDESTYKKGLQTALTMFYTHQDELDIYTQSLNMPEKLDPKDYLSEPILPHLTFGDDTHNTLHGGYGDNNADFKATSLVPVFVNSSKGLELVPTTQMSSALFEVKYNPSGNLPNVRMHDAQYLIFCTDNRVTKHILVNGDVYPSTKNPKPITLTLKDDSKITFNPETGIVKTYTQRLEPKDYVIGHLSNIYTSLLLSTGQEAVSRTSRSLNIIFLKMVDKK